MGASAEFDGRSCIITEPGKAGHAIYGPYRALGEGRYVVEFGIALAADPSDTADSLCAVIDVVHDGGNAMLARKQIYVSQLRDGRSAFALPFALREATRVEYRVWVSGAAALVIDAHRRLIEVPADAVDAEALAAAGAFPEEEGAAIPFFRDNQAMLRGLYERNIGVAVRSGAVVLTVNGIALFARSLDDMTFIGEVFFENAYNFTLGRDVCAIDIGMNIGLTSLLFASRPEVREVHSFEPFRNTYDRALDNLALNPMLAAKITPHNCGLGDQDADGTLIVNGAGDSGSRSTVTVADGVPVHVSLRDAAGALGPIIRAAAAAGRAVVLKVDCEGSEFAIFRSLGDAGLFAHVTALMVEWHAMFDDKTQETLIAPLRAAGFVVFDRSPPSGNGFFYAARVAG